MLYFAKRVSAHAERLNIGRARRRRRRRSHWRLLLDPLTSKKVDLSILKVNANLDKIIILFTIILVVTIGLDKKTMIKFDVIPNRLQAGR